jgi:hypothetical protein
MVPEIRFAYSVTSPGFPIRRTRGGNRRGSPACSLNIRVLRRLWAETSLITEIPFEFIADASVSVPEAAELLAIDVDAWNAQCVVDYLFTELPLFFEQRLQP